MPARPNRLCPAPATLCALALCLAAGMAPRAAQSQAAEPPPTDPPAVEQMDWTARKCLLYRAAWRKAASGDALEGIGKAFIAAHDDFLASDCTRRAVCPRTAQEVALADMLSLMAVAEGMAGSFLPFTCKGSGAQAPV